MQNTYSFSIPLSVFYIWYLWYWNFYRISDHCASKITHIHILKGLLTNCIMRRESCRGNRWQLWWTMIFFHVLFITLGYVDMGYESQKYGFFSPPQKLFETPRESLNHDDKLFLGSLKEGETKIVPKPDSNSRQFKLS